MKHLTVGGRTLAMMAVVLPLLALLIYVVLRSGPLAPVPVRVMPVETRSIAPGLYGIGTVEARYTYRIGPTLAARVQTLDVHVGDRVTAGQVLGTMDPIDFDARRRAQDAAIKRARAQQQEAAARQRHAQAQVQRYEQLLIAGSTSEEVVTTKQQELQVFDATLAAAYAELTRVQAEGEALMAQRQNLRLLAPVDGLVMARNADPGTTVVAGQAVVEVIEPESLWINVRFDQVSATGLSAGLAARIALRSRSELSLSGEVLRVEPLADAVTEEMLAKVVFAQLPEPLPPIGELAEVTLMLPALPAQPTVPNAALQRINGVLGVWRVENDALNFVAVKTGVHDLDGRVQVLAGLKPGEEVVIYSRQALTDGSRIKVVEQLPGVAP
ncbi:MAG: efflux RND transporter periplasmic adaptor subunit [Gammaproteobacteria bacterium]|nr:efflux RND transporter periplasmic adaptor subunit [Gammaproteobacteria bacterium]